MMSFDTFLKKAWSDDGIRSLVIGYPVIGIVC